MLKFRHRLSFLLTLSLIATALAGCQSALTGDEGNLLFTYTADDEFENFNKPVGVGARLELRIFQVGTRAPVVLNDVQSSDEEVLEIESIAGNRVIVLGTGVGNAEISVEAELPGGESVTDSVDMRGAEPDRLILRHTCAPPESEDVKYLAASSDIWLGYDLETDDGEAVIGYGLLPVEFDPVDLVTLNQTSTDQAHLHLDLPAEPQDITVSSTIDDAETVMSIVDPEAIDGVEINPLSGEAQLTGGAFKILHFWPMVGESRVCQARTPFSARSLTPEVCTVEMPSEDVFKLLNQFNSIRVDGLAEGDCEFEVTFDAGNGGEGTTQTYTKFVSGSQNEL